MKKRFCFIFAMIMVITLWTSASAAGYSLPEKMQRQLQVGSGLKGSFVIHCNADPEKSPFIHAVQNAEFEIRGIQSENNLHYYIYQPGEGEERNSLTEYSRIAGADYLRSDLLGSEPYLLPTVDYLIDSYLNSEGEENPPVFPDLLRMLITGETEEDGRLQTESFERQIELWISAFSSETTVQTGEDSSPRLTQVFRIPVESMYNAAAEMVKSITANDKAMSYLRSVLSEAQINTYLNPNLLYYYLDAMKNLSLEGEIVFSKTVSTLGELINNSLVLPLDPAKTGYSTATFSSDETCKSILLTGAKGTFFLRLPLNFDLKSESYHYEGIRLVLAENDNPDRQSVALEISIRKDHDKFDDPDEGRTNETDHYTVHIVRNTSELPESVSEEMIPEMKAVDAEAEIHYSSKLQLSSPTTMEISCRILQGDYDFSLAGAVKTASPWTFTPFDISNAVPANHFSHEELENLLDKWTESAEKTIVRTPEEIRQADPSNTPGDSSSGSSN